MVDIEKLNEQIDILEDNINNLKSIKETYEEIRNTKELLKKSYNDFNENVKKQDSNVQLIEKSALKVDEQYAKMDKLSADIKEFNIKTRDEINTEIKKYWIDIEGKVRELAEDINKQNNEKYSKMHNAILKTKEEILLDNKKTRKTYIFIILVVTISLIISFINIFI